MSAPEYDAIDPAPASNRPPSRYYHHLLMEAEKKIGEQKARIDELEGRLLGRAPVGAPVGEPITITVTLDFTGRGSAP